MSLKRGSILRADLDVDANHASFAHRFTNGCKKHLTTAVRDASLYDYVRFDLVDQLLHADEVFRELDYRPA